MRKKIILGLILLVAGAILTMWLTGKLDFFKKESSSQFKQTVERNLTQEQKQIYLDRLNKAKKDLENLQARKGVITPQEFFVVYFSIGAQYQGLGELGKAREYYQKAIAANETNYNGFTALYTVALEQEDYQGALTAIEKANLLETVEPDIWKKRIVLKEERFNASFEELDALFKSALEKTGGSVDIISAYAYFLEKNGKIDEAIKQWEMAVKIRPSMQQYKTELERVKAIK